MAESVLASDLIVVPGAMPVEPKSKPLVEGTDPPEPVSPSDDTGSTPPSSPESATPEEGAPSDPPLGETEIDPLPIILRDSLPRPSQKDEQD